MNRRFALIAAACLFSALAPASAFSQQAKPAAPTTSAPAAPAKWVPPIKGQGTVEFTQSKPQRVKGEIQTKFRLRNTSKGSIALLAVEEIWYNTARQIASNGTYRHRQLLNPGDIIEFTISSPEKPNLYSNNLLFKHANGTIDAKRVTKLSEGDTSAAAKPQATRK
jgi:hypothetical protein